ncbi:hypothetical protein Acr_10g0005410 [Actinidia rufa]|uniref:Uncharacterized protein n=1 Tax=Actinidia rufa TaxID=165716 RepID=A0A7J0F9P0_9ERIC|nr:hypothetical protein Acr_10g0005410 [Actinidia rufa]
MSLIVTHLSLSQSPKPKALIAGHHHWHRIHHHLAPNPPPPWTTPPLSHSSSSPESTTIGTESTTIGTNPPPSAPNPLPSAPIHHRRHRIHHHRHRIHHHHGPLHPSLTPFPLLSYPCRFIKKRSGSMGSSSISCSLGVRSTVRRCLRAVLCSSKDRGMAEMVDSAVTVFASRSGSEKRAAEVDHSRTFLDVRTEEGQFSAVFYSVFNY